MDSIPDGLCSPPPAKKRRLSSCNRGLPKPMLYYLKKNANPELSLKLMQTSKYFCFEEFPYTVVTRLRCKNQLWYKSLLGSKNMDSFDRDVITKELWLTNRLEIKGADCDTASELIPHIAVCDVAVLKLKYQVVTLDEFKFLSAGLYEKLKLIETTVVDEDNKVVPLETILENVNYLNELFYKFDEETAETVTLESTENIIDVLSECELSLIRLFSIPGTFDIDAFFKFMQESPRTIFMLGFDGNLSEEYTQKLQAYSDKVIEAGCDNRFPIVILFRGVTAEYVNQYTKLLADFKAKIKTEKENF